MISDLRIILFLLAVAPLTTVSCGGDDVPSNKPDATVESVPDATAELNPTFGGTISIAEVSVTNPSLEGVAGASVDISFIDPVDARVAPQPGYLNSVDGCLIFVYDLDAGEVPPKGSDGGSVTISGTNGSDLAAFDCDYDNIAETYFCRSGDDAASGTMPKVGTSLIPNNGPDTGTATLVIAGVDFSEEDYIGMQIVLSGFSEDAANGTFGIVQQTTNTLVIANPALQAVATLSADTDYQTLIGAGPIPGGFNFLDDGSAEIVVTKDAITNVPAIRTSLTVNGAKFALAVGSTLPHDVPTNGDPATFSCAGSCGVSNGLLKGIVVFGQTTDAVVDPRHPTDMPKAVSKYATFQCSGIGETLTLDADAMALVLGTQPTRIQTSVTYANGELGRNNTIIMSHGVVGFTDVP